MATEVLTCHSKDQITPVGLGTFDGQSTPRWLTCLTVSEGDKLDTHGDWYKIYRAINKKTGLTNVLIFAGYNQDQKKEMQFVSADEDTGGCKFGIMRYCPCDGFWWVKKHGNIWIVTRKK